MEEHTEIEPMKTCRFYCIEDENLDFQHKRNTSDGFCILKDLFTRCSGCSCELYQYDDGKED